MKLPYVMAIAKPTPAIAAADKEVIEELKDQNKMPSMSSIASGSSEGGMSPLVNS